MIIKQFDIPKKKEDEHLDEASHELQDDDELQGLAGDQELEEQQTIEAMAQHQIDRQHEAGEEDEDNNIEGWINEMVLISPAERRGLEESICPVKLVLVKVSCRID